MGVAGVGWDLDWGSMKALRMKWNGLTFVSTGAKGVEYPTRFFARDYAGNRLEFSL